MERAKPIAVFMAFGTKGDVYPIAVSAPFSSLLSSIWFPGKWLKVKRKMKINSKLALTLHDTVV